MVRLAVKEEALPVIKMSLEHEKGILALNLERYNKELKQFEKKYRMSSRAFYAKFQSGSLGDKAHWFDWLIVFEAVKNLKKNLSLLNAIRV